MVDNQARTTVKTSDLATMERSAHRRLQSISRHLLLPELATPHLQLNPLRADDKIYNGPSAVIVGGMVLDVHAKPSAELLPGTTTPGTIQFINGGVARNVAECMSKLGTKPFMISVLGHDIPGDLLLKYWDSAKLCTEGIKKSKDVRTPVVSNTFDCSGEVAAGVASVEAVETSLTPDWIEQFRQNIRSCLVLMVDANLHPQSIEAACRIATEYNIPVWFEPVSVAKSTRIVSVVDCITCASPNEDELIAMANALASKEEFFSIQQSTTKWKELSVEHRFLMLKPAIRVLLEKGIRLLMVTLGSDGVFLCCSGGLQLIKGLSKKNIFTSSNKLHKLISELCPSRQYTGCMKSGLSSSRYYAFHFPALPASVVSLTGAGDCLVGGFLTSICSGLDILQSTAVGIAVAKAAVETKYNVPEEYSLTRLSEDTKKVFLAARPLVLD